MTPEISRLGARLAEINGHAERLPPKIDNACMAVELRKIQSYLNRSSNGAGASRDLIQEAVSHFHQSNELPNARAARLVCWGIADTPVRDHPVLIEDSQKFTRLLDQVDQYRTELKPYRNCWRGLLNGYFSYDPNHRHEGIENWNLLRGYLWDNRSITTAKGFQPSWAATMAEHLNLLTEDPCSRYGRALFEGDETILDPLRQDLGLNDSSWLTQALVEAQISDTLRREDQDFREVLPKLLAFLSKHNNLQDSGLARVLNRYSASQSLEVHVPLRDHTVARWGKCEQLIYNLTGIPPKSGARPVSTTRSMIPVRRPSAAPSTQPTKNKVSDSEIIAFLNLRSIKFEDFRSRGGSLWVYAPQSGGDLPSILRQWNFAWVDRRNAWYWRQ